MSPCHRLPTLSLTAVRQYGRDGGTSGVGGPGRGRHRCPRRRADADVVRDFAGDGVLIYRADAGGAALDLVTT
jgi:hypothetical protein